MQFVHIYLVLAKCCLKCLAVQDECHNYICLLESLGDGSIYVCGSYAYNPQCAFIVDSTLRKGEGGDVEKEGKKGICPYEPGKPHTAVKAGKKLKQICGIDQLHFVRKDRIYPC